MFLLAVCFPAIAAHGDDLDGLRVKAEQGDGDAQLALGELYLSGEAVPQDSEEAFKWIMESASQGGNVQAAYSVAAMYWYGVGVAKDNTQAFLWATAAQLKGHDEAYILKSTIAHQIAREDIVRAQARARGNQDRVQVEISVYVSTDNVTGTDAVSVKKLVDERLRNHLLKNKSFKLIDEGEEHTTTLFLTVSVTDIILGDNPIGYAVTYYILHYYQPQKLRVLAEQGWIQIDSGKADTLDAVEVTRIFNFDHRVLRDTGTFIITMDQLEEGLQGIVGVLENYLPESQQQ